MKRKHNLYGRIRLTFLPPKYKKCHGLCLICRWYQYCSYDLGMKGKTMKKRWISLLTAFLIFAANPLPVQAMEEEQVQALAEEIGKMYGICPELLAAVAWKESSYNEKAEAGGCSGLMQVSEKWHKERMKKLDVTDLYDPKGNMLVAADYLAELFASYEDVGMVLMVYNGDSDACVYRRTGEGLSDYAAEIMEKAQELEREHGK